MRYYADEDNLHVRIYAMRGRLLSLKDYTSIIRDQGAFYDRLSATHDYVEAKETVFREQIAMVIHLAEATKKYSPLFIAFLRQYEISNAKLLFAKAFGRQSLDQWYDIGHYAILDRNLLQQDLSPDDIRTIMADTYLKDVCEDISCYELPEIQMDISAARNLYKSSAQFLPESREVFRDFMLRRITVITMIWHWRLKQSYHWSDERIKLFLETFNNLNLFGGHAWPQARIVEETLNRHLEQLRKSGAQAPSAEDIEYHLEQYYYNWVSSIFHKDFHSIHCVVAYLWLLYYQVRNLFHIVDGIRFGLPSGEILERIICEV
ncbi:MAG: V-type ATPase subunit [Deltaproteobacteria bacterium]|nr:V-type ATPase subunit [Deltaproteobacteria bacterium]